MLIEGKFEGPLALRRPRSHAVAFPTLTHTNAAKNATECEFKRFTYEAALNQQQNNTKTPMMTVFDAFELSTVCNPEPADEMRVKA